MFELNTPGNNHNLKQSLYMSNAQA